MKIFNDAGGRDGITTSDDVANANQAFTSPFLLLARVIFHSSEKTLLACVQLSGNTSKNRSGCNECVKENLVLKGIMFLH